LLQLLDELLASNGRPLRLWCNAREPAVGFYRRMGWRVISERFHIETAGPHFKMSRVSADALPTNERPESRL
jgi:ribosomal protein S18 acetylase RimI-like enzyme